MNCKISLLSWEWMNCLDDEEKGLVARARRIQFLFLSQNLTWRNTTGQPGSYVPVAETGNVVLKKFWTGNTTTSPEDAFRGVVRRDCKAENGSRKMSQMNVHRYTDGLVYDHHAAFVSVKTIDGELGILPRHINTIAVLSDQVIRRVDENTLIDRRMVGLSKW